MNNADNSKAASEAAYIRISLIHLGESFESLEYLEKKAVEVFGNPKETSALIWAATIMNEEVKRAVRSLTQRGALLLIGGLHA